MMSPLLFYVLLALLCAAADAGARRHLRQHLSRAKVSSLEETDYQPSKAFQTSALALPLIGLAGLILGAAIGLPVVYAIMWGAGYGCLRLFLSASVAAGAKRSILPRFITALDHDTVKPVRFGLFFSGPHLLTPYHVTMWLAPLLSLGEPFVVIIKERKHLNLIPKSDRYQVLVASEMKETTPYLPENLTVMFYVNNSMNNMAVIKSNPTIQHVQLLHGDSDKPPSFNPAAVSYDHLFVAGQMAVDRYARNGVHIRADKFKIVGRPQLSVPDRPAGQRKTIVYMSTWVGTFEDSNFCSLPQSHDIVRELLNAGQEADIVFKPHPVSYRDASWSDVQSRLTEASSKLPKGVTFRLAAHDEDPFELYAKADVLVTDISSTIIDYLYTGKPYIVTNPRNYSDTFLEAFPSVSGGHLANPDASNIPELLKDCLGEDRLAATRTTLQSYAFGDFGRPQGDAFRAACFELLNADRDQLSLPSMAAE